MVWDETGVLASVRPVGERDAGHNRPDRDDAEREGGDLAGPSNLAALLDQFTSSVSDPDAHTIGSFAHTVQALHAEFAMLARHFGAVAVQTADAGSEGIRSGVIGSEVIAQGEAEQGGEAGGADLGGAFDIDDVFPVA